MQNINIQNNNYLTFLSCMKYSAGPQYFTKKTFQICLKMIFKIWRAISEIFVAAEEGEKLSFKNPVLLTTHCLHDLTKCSKNGPSGLMLLKYIDRKRMRKGEFLNDCLTCLRLYSLVDLYNIWKNISIWIISKRKETNLIYIIYFKGTYYYIL